MNKPNEMHHATERVLNVLELISASPASMTLSDISKELGIPKGTLSPILKTLVSRDYISANDQSKYQIGMKAYSVGHSFLQQFRFADEVEKYLVELTALCDETCHLAVLSGPNVLYLKKVDSPQSIRMVSTIGNELPAYGTALGKALLMNHSVEDLKKLYPQGLSPITANTITDFSVLAAQLSVAREKGYTVEIEESNAYIRCIGIPLRKNGKIIAAISVATPVFRYDQAKEDLIIHAIEQTQSKIEYLLDAMNIDEIH